MSEARSTRLGNTDRRLARRLHAPRRSGWRRRRWRCARPCSRSYSFAAIVSCWTADGPSTRSGKRLAGSVRRRRRGDRLSTASATRSAGSCSTSSIVTIGCADAGWLRAAELPTMGITRCRSGAWQSPWHLVGGVRRDCCRCRSCCFPTDGCQPVDGGDRVGIRRAVRAAGDPPWSGTSRAFTDRYLRSTPRAS